MNCVPACLRAYVLVLLSLSSHHRRRVDCPHLAAGHVGAIRQLQFSADQSVLCSAGEDGHVYAFNLQGSPPGRIEDLSHVVKSCRFTTVLVTASKTAVISAGAYARVFLSLRVTLSTRDNSVECFLRHVSNSV